jgi:quercetin dioxygenase-like cupin family protein
MPTEPIRDPVHRVSYVFHPQGDDLIVESWLEPGGALPPHLHPRQVERWSVVEGKVRIQLGGTKRVIGPEDGEQLVAPNTEHALWAVADETAHLSCYVTPAYGLQAFLHDSALAAQEGLFMRGGIPKSPRGARWAARFLKQHRDDVVMSFPPRFVQSAMIGLFAR